jgi:hypothetical protein
MNGKSKELISGNGTIKGFNSPNDTPEVAYV